MAAPQPGGVLALPAWRTIDHTKLVFQAAKIKTIQLKLSCLPLLFLTVRPVVASTTTALISS